MSSPILAEAVQLDGRSLTFQQIRSVAHSRTAVEVSPEALERMQQSFELLVEATCQNIPIYGVNHGVGGNSDKDVFEGSILKPENKKLSETFNARNLRATSAALGADVPVATVRAAMLLRLNDFLAGSSGTRPETAEMYAALLNAGITPAIPRVGSIGEADIAILAHMGLTLMGEGEVYYKGEKINAAAALEAASLKKIKLFGVDSLAIMSSNAYSEALAVEILEKLRHMQKALSASYALTLEGVEVSPSHLLPVVLNVRFSKFQQMHQVAGDILKFLEGSHLFQYKGQPALSFTTAPTYYANLMLAQEQLSEILLQDLNSSKNEPSFIVSTEPDAKTGENGNFFFVKGKKCGKASGYVVDTSGYEPFHWSVQLDLIKSVLNQITLTVASQIVQLGTPSVTGLTAFLSPESGVLAFSATQKLVDQLRQQNDKLAQSNISLGLPMALGGEDTASNAPQSAMDVLAMIDNLYALIGLELIHSAQAIDLRLKENKKLALGKGTTRLHKDFRKEVEFLSEDRELSPDFARAKKFAETYDF